MNEIEFRNSTLTQVNTKQRLIDMIAIPWEQEAEIMWRGELWREMFLRGSFKGIAAHAGRVRVNREHVQGNTVGKVVHFDEDHHDGLIARVKVVETARGDETLALAAEDCISPSVGFRINSHEDMDLNKRTKVRLIRKAFLDHIAMVESPAYVGAKVLAVRAELSELPVEDRPLPKAPLLEQFENDELLAWANARVKEIEARSAGLS